MPIKTRSNNRVLPANARAVDAAQNALQALLQVERTRYHNAFMVNGYDGILYNRLCSGVRCHCRNMTNATRSRLDEKGNGDASFMNEMLTGGVEFGVRPYGLKAADTPGHNARIDAFLPNATQASLGITQKNLFVIDQDAEDFQANKDAMLPSLYDEDDGSIRYPNVGGPFDRYGKDPNSADTLVTSGVGPNGPVQEFDFEDVDISDQGGVDYASTGITDASCPICFGTFYVGGFQIYNGWRKVLNYQWPNAQFGTGVIYTEEFVPVIETSYASFDIVLPLNCVSVDALRVWNDKEVISAAIAVDGTQLLSEQDLAPFCDGKQHTITLNWDEPVTFSHLELQVNQSTKEAYFDFPKMNRNNVASMLDHTQEFGIIITPMIPLVQPDDLLADSTFGKIYQIKSTTRTNDKSNTVLGWETEVRVVQPQELYFLLPKRRRGKLQTPKTPSLVRDNNPGHRT